MTVCIQMASNEQLFKSNVCRICSLLRDKVLPIFDNAGSRVDIKIIQCFPNLNIAKGDSKPQQICIDCITKLNMFNEFLQICVESDSKFNSYIMQYYKQENSSFINTNFRAPLMQNEVSKSQESNSLENEDVIVLSKMDTSVHDQQEKDFVVMVELKYKVKSTPDKYVIIHDESPRGVENSELLDNSTTDLHCTSIPVDQDKDITDYDNSEIILENILNGNPTEKSRDQTTGNSIKEPKGKESFVCKICGRSFTRRTRLNSHMIKHSSAVQPYRCEKCPKSFSMIGEYNAHKKVHTQAFQCQICAKFLSSNSKLLRHTRVHTRERPFSCPTCDKAFSDKRNLINHIHAHIGVKPYSCEVCSKSFGVKSHLKDHLIIHSEAPKFVCKLCNKAFRWKTNYNRHRRAHGPLTCNGLENLLETIDHTDLA